MLRRLDGAQDSQEFPLEVLGTTPAKEALLPLVTGRGRASGNLRIHRPPLDPLGSRTSRAASTSAACRAGGGLNPKRRGEPGVPYRWQSGSVANADRIVKDNGALQICSRTVASSSVPHIDLAQMRVQQDPSHKCEHNVGHTLSGTRGDRWG